MKKAQEETDLLTTFQVVTEIIENVFNISLIEMRSSNPKYYEGRLLFAGILNSKGIDEKFTAKLLHKSKVRIQAYIDAYNARVLSCKKFQEVTNTVNRILTNNN